MIYDLVALVGVVLVGVGISFYDWRAALVVVGSLLVALAIYGARTNRAG